MTSKKLLGAAAVCALAVLVPFLGRRNVDTREPASLPSFDPQGQSNVCIALAEILPGSVHSDQNPAYQKSIGSYWSLNACEKKPSCVVLPVTVHEVATTVKLLKAKFDRARNLSVLPKFAVRSGGHSPEAGFASVDGGVVIDMSLLNEIVVSDDRQSASIGVGARWADVSLKLDELGLAIVGGRNADVGVGGLVLGGGISYFSPRFGMVCDNIDEYEIVLGNGSITRVTSSQHEDLWRALKGGSGNFGIVARVMAKTFPAGPIWAGTTFWTGWQTPKVLKAFADFNQPENFDEYAAGPILAICYVQRLGVKLTVNTLAYTKPEKWPPVFKSFRSIWRVWSTARIQSLTEASRHLAAMAPSGQRQFQATTTVRNDLETFNTFHEIYSKKLEEGKGAKGSIWSLIFQPLSAAVTHKGSPNVLGLESRHRNDTMIVVLIAVSWLDAQDDELVHRVVRDIIAMGDEFAQRRQTIDQYRYLNYAASNQDPIGGYGMENKRYLQSVSKIYDPDGLFQLAKQGGFKLDLY